MAIALATFAPRGTGQRIIVHDCMPVVCQPRARHYPLADVVEQA